MTDTTTVLEKIQVVDVIAVLRSTYKSLYLNTEVFLGLRMVEVVFLGLLISLALWRMGKMLMYSRVYNELFKGLKGEYGSALKEDPIIHEERKAHIQAIENAFIENKNLEDAVRFQRILRKGLIQEQIVDRSKIDASKAIAIVIKENNSKLLLIILGITAAVIFASKGFMAIDENILVASFMKLGLMTEVMMVLQALTFAVVFIMLLLILIDRKGTLMKTFINFLLNISSSGVFTLINPAVNKIVNFVRDASENIIITNILIASIGIGLHVWLGVLSLLAATPIALTLGGIFVSNLILFIAFNLFYIIIMEYDLELMMNLISKFKDNDLVQKFAGVQWLLVLRGLIYLGAIVLCTFLLLEPTRLWMADALGALFASAGRST